MNARTKAVFAAYLRLRPTERTDLKREIREYDLASPQDKIRKESIELSEIRMELGPLSGTCPYCGRG